MDELARAVAAAVEGVLAARGLVLRGEVRGVLEEAGHPGEGVGWSAPVGSGPPPRWQAHADLLSACEEGYRLAEIAVRQGLDFGPRATEQIVRDHVSLKQIREAIAKAKGQ